MIGAVRIELKNCDESERELSGTIRIKNHVKKKEIMKKLMMGRTTELFNRSKSLKNGPSPLFLYPGSQNSKIRRSSVKGPILLGGNSGLNLIFPRPQHMRSAINSQKFSRSKNKKSSYFSAKSGEERSLFFRYSQLNVKSKHGEEHEENDLDGSVVVEDDREGIMCISPVLKGKGSNFGPERYTAVGSNNRSEFTISGNNLSLIKREISGEKFVRGNGSGMKQSSNGSIEIYVKSAKKDRKLNSNRRIEGDDLISIEEINQVDVIPQVKGNLGDESSILIVKDFDN